VSKDHKASKALNKAQTASKKAQAELQKANEEVDIKKRHTVSVTQLYEKSKAKVHSAVA